MATFVKPDLSVTAHLGSSASECFRQSRELLTHSNSLEKGLASSETGKSDHLQALQLRELADGWLKVGLATRAQRQSQDGEKVDSFLGAADEAFERARALQPQREAAASEPADPTLGQVIAYVDGREFGLRRQVVSPWRDLQRDGLLGHDTDSLEKAVEWRSRELGQVAEVSMAPKEGMIRDRPLWLYHENFGPHFTELLGSLRAGHQWIDVGSGECSALADYVRNPKYAHGADVMGVDLQDPPNLEELRSTLGSRFKFQRGNVREAPLAPNSADLITDSIAAFSYDRDPAGVIESYGRALRPGGRAMLFFSDKGLRGGSGFVTPDGNFGSLAQWLGGLKGLDMEFLGALEGTGVAVLRRNAEPLEVPRTDQIAVGNMWTPPPRVFATPAEIPAAREPVSMKRLSDDPERAAQVSQWVNPDWA